MSLMIFMMLKSETPEYIANEFYGDPELHWVVLMTNDIVDYYTEWDLCLLPQFEAYVKEKYTDVNGIHHYEYSRNLVIHLY